MYKRLIFVCLLFCSWAASSQTLEEVCELTSAQVSCGTVIHFLTQTAEFESKIDQYKACTNAKFDLYKAEKNCDFNNYLEQANKNFDAYKKTLNKIWDKPTFSTNKSWVSYSPTLEIKREVDFEKNIIRVTTIKGDKHTEEELKEKIISVSSLSIGKAQKEDPYSSQVIDIIKPASLSNESFLPLAEAKNERETEQKVLLKSTKTTRTVDIKGNKVITVEAKFPSSWIKRKEQRFVEPVQKQAKRYKLDPALILAVIKTESNFIPTAISHIPAFGLMQVVPTSTGFEVTEFLDGKQRKLSKEYLFVPEKNIEAGSTYLHLLQSRYFKGIRDVDSLKFCMIAAYNGGMGPIYKIFGNGSRKRAIENINSLSSDQVFNKILTHHNAEETRNYLRRVTAADILYSQTI